MLLFLHMMIINMKANKKEMKTRYNKVDYILKLDNQ